MAHPHLSSLLTPLQFALELIGSKWSILILQELIVANRRTQELMNALPGISSKTLIARLREMEEQGLIQRQTYSEVPPRVEYSITAKGQAIQPILSALHQVGVQWLKYSSDCP